MENKKNNTGFVILITVLVVIVIALIGYIAYDKGVFGKQESTETNDKDVSDGAVIDDKEDTIDDQPSLIFDSNNCINGSNDTVYSIGTSSNNSLGIFMTIQNNNKEVVVTINPSRYTIAGLTGIGIKNYTINNFSKEIVDVAVGEFGQAAGQEALLYLMEDGTVEYTPLLKSLQENSEQLRSFGAIPEVTGVIKFLYGSESYSDGSSGRTTYAQKNDGKFYNLYSILRQTGNL